MSLSFSLSLSEASKLPPNSRMLPPPPPFSSVFVRSNGSFLRIIVGPPLSKHVRTVTQRIQGRANLMETRRGGDSMDKRKVTLLPLKRSWSFNENFLPTETGFVSPLLDAFCIKRGRGISLRVYRGSLCFP